MNRHFIWALEKKRHEWNILVRIFGNPCPLEKICVLVDSIGRK